MASSPIPVKVNPKGFDFDKATEVQTDNPTETLVSSLEKLKVNDVAVIERTTSGTALRVKAALKRAVKKHAEMKFDLRRPDKNHWAVRRMA